MLKSRAKALSVNVKRERPAITGVDTDREGPVAGRTNRARVKLRGEGDITLRVRNANYTLGPVILHIDMKPGAVIPAHLHKGMAEALYVVEGDFTNEGKQYQAGTSLHFKAGKAHGPQTTKNGCKLFVLWTERSSKESADLSDFTLANQRAA